MASAANPSPVPNSVASVAGAYAAGTLATVVPSPGLTTDFGPTLQAAFDAGCQVSLVPGASYYINSPVFLDGASNTIKYVLYANGAKLTLGTGLPVPSGWNTGIGAAPPTAFFNGVLRTALSGGTVTTTSTYGASNSPVVGRFVIHDLTAISSATASCLVFGGIASNNNNGAAQGLVNCTLNGFIAGISWNGYADGNFTEGCEVGGNPSGSQTRIIYQRSSGDGTRSIRCKAFGGVICDIASCNGLVVESPVSGQIAVQASTGQIVAGHQETDENASSAPWSVSIDRSRISIFDHYTRSPNNAAHYSIIVNDTTTASLYTASEVTIRGWRPIANYIASQGDAAKGPSLHITALNKSGYVRVYDSRGIVISAGISVGWQAFWVDSADSNITTALAAGADYLATGNWSLSYNGAWQVGSSSGATPPPRPLTAPVLAVAADTTITGGGLTNAQVYEYVIATKTAAGGYSALSSAIQATANSGGVADLTITNTTGPVTIAVWRKTGAGVAATPDRYIEIGLDAYQTAWLDTGTNFNGRPWTTTSIPVPNTVAGTGTQTLFPAVSVGWRGVFSGRGKDDAAVAGSAGMNEGGYNGVTAGSGGLNVFYLDPGDYPVGALLRLKALVLCNATAPTSTFQFDLLPVATVGGASASVTLTTSASVATVTFAAPTASAAHEALSSSIAVPAAGYYVLQRTITGNMAANSSAVSRCTVEVKGPVG